MKCRGFSGLLAIGFLGPGGAWSRLGGSGEPRRVSGVREAPGAPGTPQEQLRNEQREFHENQVFRPWEASGGLRGTQNRWGGLAGAKGKAKVIPGHPKEEGFSDSLASLRVSRASVEMSRVVRIGADRFFRSWGSLGQPRRFRGAQESVRSQGGSRSSRDAPGAAQK